MTFLGFGFSKSLSSFIIRGESAFYFGKKFTPAAECMHKGLLERNSINYLLGVDWYPGNEWSLTGQFSDEWIMDYSKSILRPEHAMVSTLGASKKVLHSNLKLSAFAYLEMEHGSFFCRSSADYALSDNIHVSGGYDWFYGDEGTFGVYGDNSQFWLKAKYNF